jgi:hypothetical protein
LKGKPQHGILDGHLRQLRVTRDSSVMDVLLANLDHCARLEVRVEALEKCFQRLLEEVTGVKVEEL